VGHVVGPVPEALRVVLLVRVGLAHARKTVAVTVGPDTIQVAVETSITVTAARTTSRDIRRHKASNYG
jgi:hypothetical protein